MLRNIKDKPKLFVARAAAEIKFVAARRGAGRYFLAPVLLLLFLAFQYAVLPAAVRKRPASLVVTDTHGFVMRGTLSTDGEWRLPVPLAEMGRWMPEVVVALEDRRFFSHNGLDVAAIFRAALQNRRGGRVISGGSTITSQVVRLSVARRRTLPGKALEFWQATALELFMSKRQILETYLNITPYGGNIRGVEAAALTWFGKQAKDMTLAEAALLAGILRSPTANRPDRYPERAGVLRDRLIDTLVLRGVATPEEAERAKLEPLPSEKKALPAHFSQAAARVERELGVFGTTDRYGRLRSTLDMNLQYLLQSELDGVLATTESGVTGAALLVENKSGAVRGYIGNAREGQAVDAAWVDCAASPRSPGSTLKPFVYALAFESGELTPASMLADVSNRTGTRNFDRMFRGPVSARTALADSLNVPAVQVFLAQGGRKTLDLYRRLGFSHFNKEADWYGESMVLGGCEVTALELARAYRTLANGGVGSQLVWAEKIGRLHSTRVMSEAASALALDVLKDTRRLLPIFNEIFGEDGTVIAFKTGTSHGRRDAWAAAVTAKYTLVIWLGDPAGKPHHQLVGISAAAQPAIRIMRKLTPRGTRWFELPKDIARNQVCHLSGAIPGPWCPQRVEDLYIDKVSRREPCKLHVLEEGKPTVKWPPELAHFFLPRPEEESAQTQQLTISSPRSGAVYMMRSDAERIELAASGGDGELFWFINEAFYDSTGQERERKIFWKMAPGKYKITAADERGNNAAVEMTARQTGVGAESEVESLPLLGE